MLLLYLAERNVQITSNALKVDKLETGQTLMFGVEILTDDYFVLSQSDCRRTDRQNCDSNTVRCITCSRAVKMRREMWTHFERLQFCLIQATASHQVINQSLHHLQYKHCLLLPHYVNFSLQKCHQPMNITFIHHKDRIGTTQGKRITDKHAQQSRPIIDGKSLQSLK